MKNIEFELVTTKGGDKGETSLYSGERKVKCDYIFDTVGDIDELNSYLGIVRGFTKYEKHIHKIQQNLLRIGAQIATNPKSEMYTELNVITEKDVYELEKWEKKLTDKAQIPQRFILPGEIKTHTAHIDVARSIARRCERRVVDEIRNKTRFDLHQCQIYLNRLSDYLFILARWEDKNGKV